MKNSFLHLNPLQVEMNSRLSSSSSFLLLLLPFCLLLVIIKFPPCSSFDFFRSCSNRFSCGNITGVEYPFWGDDRHEDCGLPDLHLTCDGSHTKIEIKDVKYKVLDIDQNAQILNISRDDLFDGLCSSKFPNTTFDPDDLFEYAPDTQQVTILYDCPLSPSTPFVPPGPPSSVPSPVPSPASAPASAPLDCPSGSDYKSAFIITGPQAATPCKLTVSVGILRSYVNGDIMGNLSKMEEAVRKGFGVKYKVETGPCRECTDSGGACANNFFNNQSECYCPGNPSPLGERKCPPPPPPPPTGQTVKTESSSNRNLIIGISAAVVGLSILFAIILCIYKREAMIFWKKENRENFDVEAFISNYTSFAPERYSYSHVKKMTNSFANIIGKGGYGCVYKGTLPDRRLVAVKVLKDSKSNGEDFINEVASMGRTSHVNIVTLLGFCYEGTKRALIYDYMPNGSLDKFIFNQEFSNTSRNCLEWKTLYEIALGIARGLEYLHRGCNTRILHFDIKPQNILLNKDFCPKISDFGLAKLWLKKESIVSMTGARGTAGYIAPEVFNRNFGGVSHKSDVYSYGMLVLEMVGGRKNIDVGVSHTSEIYFPHWIYEDIELDKDLRILRVTTEEEKDMAKKMVLVSFWCIQIIPSDRPPMSKVVEMLEGNLQSIQIPPKPFLSSPARSPQQSTKS